VAIDEELGQELQAILDRFRARWTRLQAGQGVDAVASEERVLGVGDVLQQPSARGELLGRSEAQRQGGQGSLTENADDTWPRIRAAAGSSMVVVTLYDPSAASGGTVSRCSLE
jgi:hypothetical protein